MAVDLFSLYKLHKVDAAITEIRKRAAALDPGKTILARIEFVKAAEAPLIDRAKELQQEQLDLEMRQKGIEEKIAKFDKELYGGTVVNPREVEVIQKEIVHLKEQKQQIENRILELWDLVPSAKQEAEAGEARIRELKSELARHQKQVVETKQELEREFKELTSSRKAVAEGVDPNLFKQYDLIRERCGGIGMTEVNAKGLCQRCGTSQPERTMVGLKEGKMLTCESCHRILYLVEGVV